MLTSGMKAGEKRNMGKQRAGAICVTLGVVLTLSLSSTAMGERLLSGPGSSANQTDNPAGLAIDSAGERIYLADRANNRVDVYSTNGDFEMAFGWGVANGETKLQTCTATCQQGIPGTGKGQLSGPTSIAVDNDPLSPSFRGVYVTDYENRRIQKFSPAGEHLATIGKAGTGEGEFTAVSGSAIALAVAPGGILYVLDSVRVEPASTPPVAKVRLQRFNSAGSLIPGQVILTEETAIGTSFALLSDGTFYVSFDGEGRSIRKFDLGGAELLKLVGNRSALAVDDGDHLFAGEYESVPSFGLVSTVTEYNQDGKVLRRFGYGELEGEVAGLLPHQTADGDVFVTSGDRFVQIAVPPPGPLALSQPCLASPGNIKATLKGWVNPEGSPTEYRFQYLTEEQFENGGFSNPAVQESSVEILPGEFSMQLVTASATGLVPETSYRCRVIAENSDGSATGEDGGFTTKAPLELIDAFASGVAVESAQLNGEVNPLGIQAIGYFEFVDDAKFAQSGFSEALTAPAPPVKLEFGDAEEPVVVSTFLGALLPCTTYHYVLHVANQFASFESAPRTFSTLCGAFGLSDGRAYEMVSPSLKNNAEVAVPGGRSGTIPDGEYLKTQASDSRGDSFTFTSFTSFGDPASAPAASQYLSRRVSSGWATENISPPGFLENPLAPTYRGFGPDLSWAGVVVTEPPLTAEAQDGIENLYLRDSATGDLDALTVEPPGLLKDQEFCTRFSGASADGSRVFFAATGAMAGAPKGKGLSLYEWSEGTGLRAVSILPGSQKPAAPTPRSSFGSPRAGCGMEGNLVNAVSKDGRYAFWTYAPEGQGTRLLARIDGERTIQLDAKTDGPDPSGNGIFWGASEDGHFVFFVSKNRLTAGASPNDLYRFDVVSETLSNLTEGAGEAAAVQGVLGMDEVGAHVYFAANGNLTGSQLSPGGQPAQPGQPNLYMWHEGDGLEFLGTLSSLDSADWSLEASDRTAAATPDGRHLAFLSTATEGLSEYDNRIAGGTDCMITASPRCPEAYLFDADAGSLACVSCNPGGARPSGPTQLPGLTNPFEGPRYLSADGSRLFFETFDALAPADVNGRRDVYEAERPDAGTCSKASSKYWSESEVCLSLISTGTSGDESYAFDASASGGDVFFATRSRLVGWDQDENYDLYDARVGGGFPEPTSTPPCEGEGCRGPITPSPESAGTPTASLFGAGNFKEGKKAKKRKEGKHRKHKRHKKHNHRRSGNRK